MKQTRFSPVFNHTVLILLTLILMSLCARMANAQTTSSQQGQTTAVDSRGVATVESGAVSITTNGAQELPMKMTVTEQRGSSTLRTTGSAIAPGIYNSSGQYTCFGGASAAAGGLGWSIGGGSTVSQADCYRLHRMDKAAGRAGAAMKASTDPSLPLAAREQFTKQGEAFSRLWDAEYCSMDGGKEAFAKAGMECPDETAKRAAAEQERSRAVSIMNDEPVKTANGPYYGNDPYVLERIQRMGK